MISLALIIIVIFVFLHLTREHQFYFLTVCILFPITLGTLGALSSVRIIEWLNLIVFLILLNELFPMRGKNLEKKHLSFKGLEIFFLAFIVIIIWAGNSVLVNEVFEKVEIGISVGRERGVLRTYFNIINNILTYFNFIIFMYLYHKDINILKWLNLILYSSLAFGALIMISFFLDINIPFFAAKYSYGTGTDYYGGLAFRISGLTEAAGYGFSVILAKYHITKKINYYFLFLFFVFTFFSGGRSFVISYTAIFFIYAFFFEKKFLVFGSIFVTFLILLAIVLLPPEIIEGQFARYAAASGGVDSDRVNTWLYFYRNFIENPIWGKGIGMYKGFIEMYDIHFESTQTDIAFVLTMQTSGGHGSYLSILSTFGLGGAFYLIVLVFGSAIMTFRKLKKYFYENSEVAAMLIFVLLLLGAKCLDNITSGNGINDYQMIFYASLVASIRVIENRIQSEQIKI